MTVELTRNLLYNKAKVKADRREILVVKILGIYTEVKDIQKTEGHASPRARLPAVLPHGSAGNSLPDKVTTAGNFIPANY